MTSNFYVLLKFQLKNKLGISRIKEILSGSASKKISFAGGVMLKQKVEPLTTVDQSILQVFEEEVVVEEVPGEVQPQLEQEEKSETVISEVRELMETEEVPEIIEPSIETEKPQWG